MIDKGKGKKLENCINIKLGNVWYKQFKLEGREVKIINRMKTGHDY